MFNIYHVMSTGEQKTSWCSNDCHLPCTINPRSFSLSLSLSLSLSGCRLVQCATVERASVLSEGPSEGTARQYVGDGPFLSSAFLEG